MLRLQVQGSFFKKNKFIYFIYFWLHWVFVAARGPSLSCGELRPLIAVASPTTEHGLLGAWASVVMAHGLSCSAACGIPPDQGSNPCPLHWQADSQPLCHQGSPQGSFCFLNVFFLKFINLLIYFWLCWVFISVRGLSLVAASGGHSSSRCADLSLSQPLIAEHRLQTHRLSSCGSRA